MKQFKVHRNSNIFFVYNINLPTKRKHVLPFFPQNVSFYLPSKTSKVMKTSSNLDPRLWCDRHRSIVDFRFCVTNCFAMQSSLWRKIENRPMPLTSWSWVQIAVSSAKFTQWLAQNRKSKILGSNGDTCLLWMSLVAFWAVSEKLAKIQASTELELMTLRLRCTCSNELSSHLEAGHLQVHLISQQGNVW